MFNQRTSEGIKNPPTKSQKEKEASVDAQLYYNINKFHGSCDHSRNQASTSARSHNLIYSFQTLDENLIGYTNTTVVIGVARYGILGVAVSPAIYYGAIRRAVKEIKPSTQHQSRANCFLISRMEEAQLA